MCVPVHVLVHVHVHTTNWIVDALSLQLKILMNECGAHFKLNRANGKMMQRNTERKKRNEERVHLNSYVFRIIHLVLKWF